VAGVAGSCLNGELNRLANGGTYPTSTAGYMDECGAANKWAATTGLSLVGALNSKASTAAKPLDLRGVCNKLAGTSDLDPVTALRTLAS
jgi:hypothetical protein